MTNHLANSHSPYLLQHQDNPVDWYPWGEVAFARARAENKPIFLSIGYSTCYWCHMMEQDSFEHQQVGDALRQNYISIKVDREERPDVDQLYMDAVIGFTGHGGWPMSVFLTPDLKPFWGGTFFYRPQFLQILESIAEAWDTRRTEIEQQATGVASVLRARSGVLRPAEAELSADLFTQFTESLAGEFDPTHGGFSGAPKFPPSQQLRLLLRNAARNRDDRSRTMAEYTLECMARGGIYDHLGGGFARYSTDAEWLVPHFEKMLYDNAALAVAYFEAAAALSREDFTAVGRDILDYVIREMTDPSGGFHAAEDAGAAGKEGEFYVWSDEELRDALTDTELAALRRVFTAPPGGNFEGGKIVLALRGEAQLAQRDTPEVHAARAKLLALRKLRSRPHLDDKVLTSWNGLMLSALSRGYQLLGDIRYREAATRCAEMIERDLTRDGRLMHRFWRGSAGIPAMLEDYSYLISGLIDLYEADFAPRWILWARALQRQQDELFWDAKDGGYWSSVAEDVIVHRKDYIDGATPSVTGVALQNLVRLHGFFGERALLERFDALISIQAVLLRDHPAAVASALLAYDLHTASLQEIAVVDGTNITETEQFIHELWRRFPRDFVLARSTGADSEKAIPLLANRTLKGNKTTVYVCRDQSCVAPSNDLESVLPRDQR